MLRLVFIGPQGSGKGTQGELVSREYKIPAISTGQLYREHIARGTELGREAAQYVAAGKLVPTELTNHLIAERLKETDAAHGFILDGYPRDTAQAEFLETIASPTHVIVLHISDDEAVARLAARYSCAACGAIYNLVTNPPQRSGVCDACGGALTQRDDDREEAIRERLAAYHAQTLPVIAYYRSRGILHEVAAQEPIATVFIAIKNVLP